MIDERENFPKKDFNHTLLRETIYCTNNDLSEEMLLLLISEIDNHESFSLLISYLKKNIKVRLPILITELNFDLVADPKSFDSYVEHRDKIEKLLEEKDGVEDWPKREQVRELLKAIQNNNIAILQK